MKIKNKSVDSLIAGFLCLIAAVAANVLLHKVFHESGESEATLSYRIILKILINVFLVGVAVSGALHNRTKRNMFLIIALILYGAGDVLALKGVMPMALPYLLGHAVMIYLLVQTTAIRKYQVRTYIIMVVLGTIMVFTGIGSWGLLNCAGFGIYQLVVLAVAALCLTNPFYLPGGVLFAASDFLGFLRVVTINNPTTYVITLSVYYLAILGFAASTFFDANKEVVTANDVLSLCDRLDRAKIKYYVGGSWGMTLLRGQRTLSHRALDILYDGSRNAEILKIFEKLRFAESEAPGRYYSEVYGTVALRAAEFNEKGSCDFIGSEGKTIHLDSEMFGEVKVGRFIIPCVAPADQKSIEAFESDINERTK